MVLFECYANVLWFCSHVYGMMSLTGIIVQIHCMHSEVVEGIFKGLVYMKRKFPLLPPFSKWLMGIHPLHPLWLYRLEDTGGGVAWCQETYVIAAGRACLGKSCRALRHYASSCSSLSAFTCDTNLFHSQI